MPAYSSGRPQAFQLYCVSSRANGLCFRYSTISPERATASATTGGRTAIISSPPTAELVERLMRRWMRWKLRLMIWKLGLAVPSGLYCTPLERSQKDPAPTSAARLEVLLAGQAALLMALKIRTVRWSRAWLLRTWSYSWRTLTPDFCQTRMVSWPTV